jgi:hypothetical protein
MESRLHTQAGMTREVPVTWLDTFPGLSGDVIAKLRARGIRSVGGAVRAARQVPERSVPITHAIPRMQLDRVLDREAAHLLLMMQVAADMPAAVAAATSRRTRRRPPDC